MKIIKVILIIVLLIVAFCISIFVGTKLPEKEPQKQNEISNTIIENVESKNEVLQGDGSNQIKCDRIGIDVETNNDTIKQNMVKCDENTYVLSIKDIEAYERIEKVLGIKYKFDDDTRIDKDTFEKYNNDVLLAFVENKNKVGIQYIAKYEDKIVINFADERIITPIQEKQIFCVLISKEDTRENIEISY